MYSLKGKLRGFAKNLKKLLKPEDPGISIEGLKVVALKHMTDWRKKLSEALLQTEFAERPESNCRVIVEMNRRNSEKIAALVNANQGKVHREIHTIPVLAIELPYVALEELALLREVRRIWHDGKVKAMLDIAVPTVGGDYVQKNGYTGKDMVAAVIDTGIYPHRDLTIPENRIIGWVDLVNQAAAPYDDNGHGTHIAGIIAGNGASSRGRYRGMAPEAKLVGIKALDSSGSGNISDIIAGIEWVIEYKEQYQIRAINLSLGATAQSSYRFDPLCRATTAAWRNGLVVCAAAGNDGPETGTINTPGINPAIITVGNLDDRRTFQAADDQLNASSSRGPTIDNLLKPDLLTPGTEINSLRNGRGYRQLTGTSMATAVATGATLQMVQKWPSLRPDEVKQRFITNARSIELEPALQGAGVLNVEQTFEKAAQSSIHNPLFNVQSGFFLPLRHLAETMGFPV